MPAPWLPVFLLLAAADWLALWRGWQRVNYLTKPAAMLALLIGFGWQGHFAGSLLWVGLGFGFSLLGDVFLLLSHGWFIYGLAAFLLAHISYIIGFLFPCPELNPVCWLPAEIIVSSATLIFPCQPRRSRASSRRHSPVWRSVSPPVKPPVQ